MVFIKDSQGRVLAKDDEVQQCWSRSERAATIRLMTEQVIATLSKREAQGDADDDDSGDDDDGVEQPASKQAAEDFTLPETAATTTTTTTTTTQCDNAAVGIPNSDDASFAASVDSAGPSSPGGGDGAKVTAAPELPEALDGTASGAGQ